MSAVRVDTTSTIASVNLVRAGVVVTRRAEVTFEGTTEAAPQSTRATVRVPGLPIGLADASIAVKPSAGCVVRSTRLGLERSVSPKADEERLEGQRALDAKAAALAVELEEVDRSIAGLRGLRFPCRPPPPEGAKHPPSDVTARLALLADIAAATKELVVTKTRLGAEVERAEEQAREHAQKTEEARQKGAFEKALTIELERTEDAVCSFEISYFMQRARWIPTYVLRVDRARSEATLELRASIAQATGERWDSVALTLSTGDPHRFCELPELQSLRIGRQQPGKPSGFRPLTVDPRTLFEDYERAQAARPTPHTPPAQKPRSARAKDKNKKQDDAYANLRQSAPRDEPVPEMMDHGSIGYGGMGGAPGSGSMPMPMAAPMQFQPQSVERAKMEPTASLERTGGAVGRATRVPAPAKGRGLFSRSAAGADASLDLDAGEPDAATRTSTDDRVFAYDSLRMPAFQERRGKLVLFERTALYRELWVSSEAFDESAFAREEQAGLSLGEPPPRSRTPEPDAGFHHRLEGRVAVSVAPDGQYHSVPLLQLSAPMKLRHVVVPRESTDVFRRVDLVNPLDVPLLAGPCDVYVDGEFLLTTDLETVGPRGELSIPMGVEQSIRVVRNTKFAEATEGLIGGTLALRHELTIEVQNHLAHTCELEVRERVPVADDKEENVRIELGQVKPAWSSVRPRSREVEVKGAYAWKLELEKDARTLLSATYVVRVPSKYELEGGNRRA